MYKSSIEGAPGSYMESTFNHAYVFHDIGTSAGWLFQNGKHPEYIAKNLGIVI